MNTLSSDVENVFAVLTLWLKRGKECLADMWQRRGVPLLADSSSLLQQLIHIIWTNAESPVTWFTITVIYWNLTERTSFSFLFFFFLLNCKYLALLLPLMIAFGVLAGGGCARICACSLLPGAGTL